MVGQQRATTAAVAAGRRRRVCCCVVGLAGSRRAGGARVNAAAQQTVFGEIGQRVVVRVDDVRAAVGVVHDLALERFDVRAGGARRGVVRVVVLRGRGREGVVMSELV